MLPDGSLPAWCLNQFPYQAASNRSPSAANILPLSVELMVDAHLRAAELLHQTQRSVEIKVLGDDNAAEFSAAWQPFHPGGGTGFC